MLVGYVVRNLDGGSTFLFPENKGSVVRIFGTRRHCRARSLLPSSDTTSPSRQRGATSVDVLNDQLRLCSRTIFIVGLLRKRRFLDGGSPCLVQAHWLLMKPIRSRHTFPQRLHIRICLMLNSEGSRVFRLLLLSSMLAHRLTSKEVVACVVH